VDQLGMDFDQFSVDNGYEEDDHYRTSVDNLFLTNDIPFMFPSQENRRRRRGIIEECCKNACRKRDLVKFCPIKG
jgi:hypothetical protein